MFIGKKSESSSYSEDSQDFIPVACHYNKETLLTKNGELIQTIQVRGLNSDKISNNLEHLRAVVRDAIKNDENCKEFAFWIHTIRRKANLDYDADYHNTLSKKIHHEWIQKNYWHDKFANKLYITVVHSAPKLKLKNFNSFINSLIPEVISSFEEKLFKKACDKLTQTVDGILESLGEYEARKLGVITEGNEYYSDPMFLYARIMQLREERCKLPMQDLSIALADHEYILGNDKIEVLGEEGKKFAAIMSFKEYQEISAEALDHFLQIPVEMITTEVFYFVDQKDVVPKFKYQNYVLETSNDSNLKKIKGIDKIINHKKEGTQFCHQQISFMVIGDNIDFLEKQVVKASDALSKLGIVHVREDIDLEKVFWSQLPGNFSFLSRMKPTIFSNTSAFASLHHFATGHLHNPWGRFTTLVQTERKTPYFLNFHDKSGHGSTCIFGDKNTGKTTLMNFLISESNKYNPAIIYITQDESSDLYLSATKGKWLPNDKEIVNPLLCKNSKENKKFLFEFFKIIAQHYFNPMSKEDLDTLKKISEDVFKIDIKKRSLSKIISSLKKTDPSENTIKTRLSEFTTNGKYSKIFESKNPLILEAGDIAVMDLQKFNDQNYIKKNYPKEKKLIEQFEYDLNIMQSVKMAITYSLQNIMNNIKNCPKIFTVDNINEIVNLSTYSDFVSKMMSDMSKVNGVFVTSVNIESLKDLYKKNHAQKWIDELNTSFIFPPEMQSSDLAKILRISENDITKLSNFSSNSRMFLIKQEGKVIGATLGIEKLTALTKFLSSGKEEKRLYEEIIREFGKDAPENWVQALFEEFQDIEN